VLQEFFVNATRKIAKPLSAETAKEIVADMSHWHVHVPAADDALDAIGIHQRAGISIWDSMIVRSAAEMGCNVLYSEDFNTGQDYSEVRVENPFQPPKAAAGHQLDNRLASFSRPIRSASYVPHPLVIVRVSRPGQAAVCAWPRTRDDYSVLPTRRGDGAGRPSAAAFTGSRATLFYV
jgi:hypothetical protein